MYYPSSGNKGADQLRGYREADLRLCFRLCRLLVFPWGGSFDSFQVRDQAQQLLLKLMMPASTPQYVFERIIGAFNHKLWHVREGVLVCLQYTINRYGVTISFVTISVLACLISGLPKLLFRGSFNLDSHFPPFHR